MMNEKITIENFGRIQKATIPLNRINIFIGPQASGKSVTAKLVYFFKELFNHLSTEVLLKNKDIDEGIKSYTKLFYDYFPRPTYDKTNSFSIKYELNDHSITLKRENYGEVSFEFSEAYIDLFALLKKLRKEYSPSSHEYDLIKLKPLKAYLDYRLEKFKSNLDSNVFIPAGRSFFSNLENSIFTFVHNEVPIDKFLSQFGMLYERVKTTHLIGNSAYKDIEFIEQLISEIIVGEYIRHNDEDHINLKDGNSIPVSQASSGQQEALPMMLIMKDLVYLDTGNRSVFVEEPEAHLFPSSQQKIVKLIATIFNAPKHQHQFTITTHSPYILTSFNNLLQAGIAENELSEKEKLYKIINKFEILQPGTVNAFLMKDGGVQNIVDEEYGLIQAELIDSVSEDISLEFEQMLDLI